MTTDAEGAGADSGAEPGINPIEVKVVGVYEHPKGGFVLLRDSRGRAMPIFIGHPEALSISLALEGHATPRPLTHDLLVNAIRQLGGSAERLVITRVEDNTFYAALRLRQGEREMELDCRPSDGIAAALRFQVPVYVAEAVLEESQVEWRNP
jgi:uncharacterized protein